ncbi:MAG: hypothetical protein H6718_00230 [Polyangiaceae bacterium]|nr:hypothetical protein [Polyangiaceae bacterium]
MFEYYENTYGPYTFGPEVGSVSVNWGGGDYGGMEHHPYWHMSSGSMYRESLHAHEAAHGWYGNGVRLSCWEDFVLSEGTATYLAARGLEHAGVDVWPEYECELRYICDPMYKANTIVLPDQTCNQIDILNAPLWSSAPYYKGAFFFREVANTIGAAVLDQKLADFYAAHVGQAARMQDLLDFIKQGLDAQLQTTIDGLVDTWLRALDCPIDPNSICQ